MNDEKIEIEPNPIRKRLMFLTTEDLYYVTYNCLVILKVLGCVNEKTPFKDSRKFAYLIDIVSNQQVCKALLDTAKNGKLLSANDKETLQRAYAKAKDRAPIITRLINVMEQRGLISTIADSEAKLINCYLNESTIPKSFLNSEIFENEINNTKILKEAFPKIRTVSRETLVGNIFKKNGVSTWLD